MNRHLRTVLNDHHPFVAIYSMMTTSLSFFLEFHRRFSSSPPPSFLLRC